MKSGDVCPTSVPFICNSTRCGCWLPADCLCTRFTFEKAFREGIFVQTFMSQMLTASPHTQSPRVTRFAWTSIWHARHTAEIQRKKLQSQQMRNVLCVSQKVFVVAPFLAPAYPMASQTRKQQTFRWFGAIMWIKVFSFLRTFGWKENVHAEANIVLPTLMAPVSRKMVRIVIAIIIMFVLFHNCQTKNKECGCMLACLKANLLVSFRMAFASVVNGRQRRAKMETFACRTNGALCKLFFFSRKPRNVQPVRAVGI